MEDLEKNVSWRRNRIQHAYRMLAGVAAMIIMADRKKLLVHVKNYSKCKSFCF